jgi:N-methylhydantoinase A
VFGATLDQPLEVVGWKVEASGPEPDFISLYAGSEAGSASGGAALKGRRKAFFPAAGGLIDCPVYDRYALAPGDRLAGPCLVEERESTCLLDVGDGGEVDRFGNLIASIGEA